MGNIASLASLSIIVEEISITKKMYGWTKHGGARHGLVKTNPNIWYCQCCGQEQTKTLASYMYEVYPREYLRLCSRCWFEIKNGSKLEEVKNRRCEPKTIWYLITTELREG